MIDPATLFAEAECFLCGGGLSEAQMMELSLLARLAKQLNPMAVTDSQGLADIGKCYQCAGETSFFQMFKLALLKQIAEAGGSTDTTPATLIEQGKCYQCAGQLSTGQTMEIALLAQIAS